MKTMPTPGVGPPRDTKTQRLGAALRRLREEQGVSAAGLARTTGLSRSYVTYLESGKFAEVGLDKFSRIVQTLGLSADRVLREAGYLPATKDMAEAGGGGRGPRGGWGVSSAR